MADPLVPAPADPAQDENSDPAPATPDAPAPNQPASANPVGPTLPVPNQPTLMQPALAAPQIIHQQVLNWSHFKPEFAGRPEVHAEGHLLHTNDWMVNHTFPQDVKVQCKGANILLCYPLLRV